VSCNEPNTAAIGLNSIGSKEFQAEFYALNARVDRGLSLDRRPDAISYDYLTAFSLGPIQLGDFSAGPVNRPWYVRASGSQIFAARQNDTADGFDDETLVFQFAGVGATEIDAAFDQSAHILVAMERPTGAGDSPEIWIYYFDPFSASYQLVNFGRGRTPRAALDDILDSSNADILVFYIADDTGLCWRQQRERYLVERVVTQAAPTIPDTSLMTMVGPLTFTYIYPPDGIAGFLSYPIRVTVPPTYTGPDAPFDGYYPYDPVFQMRSPFGTLRLFPDPTNGKTYYPFTGFQGVLEDNINFDYGTIVSKRDYGAVLDFPETVYYAEVETWNSFYGGGALRALDENNAVVNEFVFGAGDVSGTRQLAYVYSQRGFKKLHFLSSSQDSRKWANVRYSTSQIPGVSIPAPLDFPNTYLEDVYKATSGRVVIIYSVHDPVAGTYSLDTIATVLYPTILPTENWTSFKTVPLSGILFKILRFILPPGYVDPVGDPPDAYDQVDQWKVPAATPDSGILHDTIIPHTLFDVDAWKSPAATPVSGILLTVIILHTLFDVDEWKVPAATPVSGILFLAIIDHHLFDTDEWKSPATIPVSGTLV
jgi:hypothetical protein